MTLPRLLLVVLATAALAGCATVAGANSATGDVVVVADASVAPELVRSAQRAAGPDAELRVPRTATEQLSVTHWFAARGYDIVGVGLSRRVAVDPVAERYPQVRFVLLGTDGARTALPARR
jgi:basic membrane lipoprotein Med (substrate-binding protein (PBP1-ABC) superfamily)